MQTAAAPTPALLSRWALYPFLDVRAYHFARVAQGRLLVDGPALLIAVAHNESGNAADEDLRVYDGRDATGRLIVAGQVTGSPREMYVRCDVGLYVETIGTPPSAWTIVAAPVPAAGLLEHVYAALGLGGG